MAGLAFASISTASAPVFLAGAATNPASGRTAGIGCRAIRTPEFTEPDRPGQELARTIAAIGKEVAPDDDVTIVAGTQGEGVLPL